MSSTAISTATPRASSSRTASILCRVVSSSESASQSRRGGSGVRPARTTRRAPRSASQPAVSNPRAPMPPVIRYAASARQRRGSRYGSRVASSASGASTCSDNWPSRSDRMVFAGVLSSSASMSAAPVCPSSARSTSPPHSCGCSAPITPATPHRQLCRTASREPVSRTPRVTIHSRGSSRPSRAASRRTMSATSAVSRAAHARSSSSVSVAGTKITDEASPSSTTWWPAAVSARVSSSRWAPSTATERPAPRSVRSGADQGCQSNAWATSRGSATGAADCAAPACTST